jgi:hypothetical protein
MVHQPSFFPDYFMWYMILNHANGTQTREPVRAETTYDVDSGKYGYNGQGGKFVPYTSNDVVVTEEHVKQYMEPREPVSRDDQLKGAIIKALFVCAVVAGISAVVLIVRERRR